MSDLSVEIGKLKLQNPVLAASGTFGYGLEFESLIDLNQLGGFVTKGLSLSPRPGNKPHRIYETASGMLNSIGLHNIGVDAFIKDKLPKLKKYKTAVIANIYGETPDEFTEVARKLSDSEGISALEINVSCPNVAGGLDIGTDPKGVFQLVDRVRKVTLLPLLAKLTPNVTDVRTLAAAAIEAGVDGLSLINSVRGMAIDLDQRKPQLSNVTGGLTGPAIKPIALAIVYQVAHQFKIPILGIGGIASGRDALEFIVAGASAVQVGTANFVKTTATIDIVHEIEEYLTNHQIPRIRDLTRTLVTV